MDTNTNHCGCDKEPSAKYQLDTVSKGSTVFRNPRALICSVPSAARALLRARGFLVVKFILVAKIPLDTVSKLFRP